MFSSLPPHCQSCGRGKGDDGRRRARRTGGNRKKGAGMVEGHKDTKEEKIEEDLKKNRNKTMKKANEEKKPEEW